MSNQLTFYDLRWPKARQSRLQLVLTMLDRVVDWAAFERAVDAAIHYPRPGNGRRPVSLGAMLRIHVVAWLTGANDRQAEELLIDSPSVCSFCRVDDAGPRPPDAETIGNFRRRLAKAGLESIVHEYVGAPLAKQGASLTPGQIIEPRWSGPLL
ncbi:MAG: transposase [Candidatus Accumulibacter meliphilus]|jgi:IS5 family transposase|uniref:Transposase n=1 Tax=Candidatus Accumulibacter meliphilus TaxID=2211374 RepID=A0A369XK68_9PROT|nr:MAG: transposase [Candidatus Accumulibacter meliphilus]